MATFVAHQFDSYFRPHIRQINRANVSAGVAVLMIYLFAGLPIQIGVLTQMGLTADEASRWFFITWMTTGLFSFGLAVFTRQPVSVNLSIPALIFLGGAAGGFTLPQILGANLLVGVVAVGLSAFRVANLFARLVPAQVALGVFAGSMALFMLKTSQLASHNLVVSVPVLVGFVSALWITRNQLLAVAIAAVAGMIGVLFSDGIPSAGGSMTLPQVFSVSVEFAPAAMIALGAPLLILVVGVGNIQSLAILRSEGFDMKGNLMGLTAGCVTLINAMFGGHAASIGGAGTPLGAGSSAGVKEFRFWAIIISSVPVVLIAFAATPIIALIQELPVSYTLTVGALALVAPFKQVLLKSLAGSGKAGALTAIVAATIPVQLAGMPMAFWALVAGVVVTMLASQKVVGCLHRVRTFVVPGYARA